MTKMPTSQKHTIIGACDYSIASMQNLKRELQDISAINPELNWAVGGMVATLVSNLLQICDQVFQESSMGDGGNALHDLQEIATRWNQFVVRMLTHE